MVSFRPRGKRQAGQLGGQIHHAFPSVPNGGQNLFREPFHRGPSVRIEAPLKLEQARSLRSGNRKLGTRGDHGNHRRLKGSFIATRTDRTKFLFSSRYRWRASACGSAVSNTRFPIDKVADEIARHGAGASTFSDWWAYKFEVYDAIPYAGALMHERGTRRKVSIVGLPRSCPPHFFDNGKRPRPSNTDACPKPRHCQIRHPQPGQAIGHRQMGRIPRGG